VARSNVITLCLVGFEKYKARPDLSGPSGFWLRVNTADASPFVAAFNASPEKFHEFLIEQRVRKETRRSTLSAQIVKIEEDPAGARILIRPDPSIEAALGSIARE
jgi:hypothetical protein